MSLASQIHTVDNLACMLLQFPSVLPSQVGPHESELRILPQTQRRQPRSKLCLPFINTRTFTPPPLPCIATTTIIPVTTIIHSDPIYASSLFRVCFPGTLSVLFNNFCLTLHSPTLSQKFHATLPTSVCSNDLLMNAPALHNCALPLLPLHPYADSRLISA